ncbi:MAG: cytochrome c biogenesis CcdA family protein [Dehalococcoidia bacterium]
MVEFGIIGLAIAFAAGIASVLSPCVLPLIPIYMGYLTGASGVGSNGQGAVAVSGSGEGAIMQSSGGEGARAVQRTSPFLHAVSFIGGFSLVFIIFGVSLGIVGFLLRDQLDVLFKAAGVLLIILGLHLSGVITIPYLEQERRFNVDFGQKVGYGRSFLVGSAFSVGWSPCVGPTLGGILLLAASSGTVYQGGLLLAVYSLGFAVPFLAIGLAFNAVQGVFRWLQPYLGGINFASGALIIIVGILVFTNSFSNLNSSFDFLPFESNL